MAVIGRFSLDGLSILKSYSETGLHVPMGYIDYLVDVVYV